MYTQCPKCRTIFNVTEEILAVKAGLVRCGDCENVFNATWNLVDEDVHDPEGSGDIGAKTVENAGYDSGDNLGYEPGERFENAGDDEGGANESPGVNPPAPSPARPGRPVSTPARGVEGIDFDDTRFFDEYVGDSNDHDGRAGLASEAKGETPRFDDEQPRSSRTGDDESISDEEIHRTLRLSEDLDAGDDDAPEEGDRDIEDGDDEPTDERQSPRGGRIEPRLDGDTPRGLSVSADDGLLPRRPVTKEATGRTRPRLARRPAIAAGSSKRDRERRDKSAAAPQPAPRHDPNVHWVSIPEQNRRGARLLWASGVLVLIVVAALQVRFLLVDELFAIPAARPYISMLCKLTGCRSPTRTAPGAIRIAQTRVDLHPEVPGAIRININLINQAPFAQPYPAIQLTLTDKDGRVVGRRTYVPADYLDERAEGALLDPGLLAVATINLAHPNENAVGFETQVVAGAAK